MKLELKLISKFTPVHCPSYMVITFPSLFLQAQSSGDDEDDDDDDDAGELVGGAGGDEPEVPSVLVFLTLPCHLFYNIIHVVML